jgi:uncharacterized membrane protein
MVTIDARAGKWLALALLLSLGVNVFLGGLVAGRHFGQPAASQREALAPGGPIQRLVASLPPDDRGAVQKAFAKRRAELAGDRRAVQAARAQVAQILAADTYDLAAQQKAFTEALQRLLHEGLAEAAQEMSVEGRRSLVESARKAGVR